MPSLIVPRCLSSCRCSLDVSTMEPHRPTHQWEPMRYSLSRPSQADATFKSRPVCFSPGVEISLFGPGLSVKAAQIRTTSRDVAPQSVNGRAWALNVRFPIASRIQRCGPRSGKSRGMVLNSVPVTEVPSVISLGLSST